MVTKLTMTRTFINKYTTNREIKYFDGKWILFSNISVLKGPVIRKNLFCQLNDKFFVSVSGFTERLIFKLLL